MHILTSSRHSGGGTHFALYVVFYNNVKVLLYESGIQLAACPPPASFNSDL